MPYKKENGIGIFININKAMYYAGTRLTSTKLLVIKQRKKYLVNETQAIESGLQCSICKELVYNPQECEQCERLFCSVCIQQWLKERSKCIISKVLCPTQCSPKPMILKNKVHSSYRNQIDSLKVRCPNSLKGCNKILCLNSFISHQYQCGFSLCKCTNKGCPDSYDLKDAKTHETLCGYRFRECKCCKLKYPIKDQLLHDCTLKMRQNIQELSDKVKNLENTIETIQKKVCRHS